MASYYVYDAILAHRLLRAGERYYQSMKYLGLLILLGFFILTAVAFISDIKFGKDVQDSDSCDEDDKRKASLRRGIIGIVIEIIILLYFGILLIYYALH